ncbi:MAG: cytochrome c biosis protein CcmG, thiol:disulfide interchange protein DsbE [Chloroflexota bacterium]|nr:cytochrome c biosis protein CcmG, thiol:disulfide interchange protein DsbE [Chloroflexota bacterium]
MRLGGDGGAILGSPLLDKPAPDFQLARLDGTLVRLSGYRGRPVIVNFWASWCIPCRDEFPEFVAARAQHAQDGLEILGIVHLDGADAAAGFARERGADWPLLLDPKDEAWKAYQGIGVPSTYFIDREGVVRATSLGPVSAAALPIQLAKIL